jgi:hypothetical protein
MNPKHEIKINKNRGESARTNKHNNHNKYNNYENVRTVHNARTVHAVHTYVPTDEIVHNEKFFKINTALPIVIVQTKYHPEKVFVAVTETKCTLKMNIKINKGQELKIKE